MRAVVVDASVMLAALKPGERFHRAALDALHVLAEERRRGEAVVVEPPVWRLEVWNSVHRLEDVDPDCVRTIDALQVEFHPVAPSDIEGFLAWVATLPTRPAVRRGADFEYLVVARARRATLVTLDPGMLECAGFGVTVLEAYAYR